MSFQLFNSEKKLITFALLLICIYLSPLYILGEHAHIRVHDNLDSNIAWYKVLSESGQILGPINATIPQVANGLPRNAFGTEFSLIVWLYKFFPTMTAYALSQTITRFFAFLGMYILLRDHFLCKRDYQFINVGVALAFSLTPFWPSGMLSTLGMPLALWAFLHIRKEKRTFKHYIVLTLLPLYSSIVLGFFFFLFAMGLFWVIDFLRGRRNFHFLLAIVYMTLVYLAVEYRLVYSFLFDDDPNSRDEYFHARLSLWRCFRLSFKNFVLGHTHVMTVHGLFILIVTFIALFLIVYKKLWKQERAFVILLILNFFLSTWYAFWFYKGWLPLTRKFHFMDTFNFARFQFLRPLVIYVGFALGLKIIWNNRGAWKPYVPFFIIAQILLLFCFNDEIIYRKKPSVNEFYSVELFDEIKSHIGLPLQDYRVASIGIHPAITQYNGFYTLDTYNNFYPLSYKYKFRKIIENELAKNKTIRTYFDEWGGRCYIFTSELGKHYMFKKNNKRTLKELDLNITPFKEMGGAYIFSALPIENPLENHLKLEKTFQSDESVWKIYLYKAL
ncbi:DUF6044 family protein [Metabacillus sediminilitoris]|uniref:YkoS n=1 Tax=Metabacillus sediminilitoris TaxID=2567941 RepID=A0A4S4BN41_9BACI|nr:DUF6044 family protein [Metabacillus sediminilitoris]QGQ44128.1 hypothetical protein GMB29_01590 [Metabacillus sediminilitoris]THF73909.1 hypothetical protein E6W99_25945 [Metabacillus sediminilitoris]